MKGSHIYERMNNSQVVKVYLHMIKNDDLNVVKALVGNITLEADDHPRYGAILSAFESRLIYENNKE